MDPSKPDLSSPGEVRSPALVALFRLGRRRPWTVVGIAVLVFGLATVLASRVRIETDVLSLIPSSNRPVQEFRRTLERFGSLDLMLVAIELDGAGIEGEDADKDVELLPTLAFADLLARELRATDGVEWLEYRSDEARRAAVDLVPLAPLFLSSDDLQELLVTVSSEAGLDRASSELAQSLRSPASLALGDLRRLDPLGMVAKAWARIDTEALDRRFDSETGFLIDPDRRFVLLLVKPARPAADVAFGRTLLADVQASIDRTAQAWQGAGDPAIGRASDPPRVVIGGGHAVAVADAERITRDLIVGTALALLSVGLLFGIAFRRWAALPVAFAPLILGLAVTFAFAAVVLGRLNAVTAAFAALLVGLGIDFVIVLYGRYAEERTAGHGPAMASDLCARRVAPGVLLGAITTAVTFFAFLVSDFDGLWELGLLTGGGIMLVLAAVFLLLPAVLALVDRPRPGSRVPSPLRGFGSQGLFLACYRYPGRTLAFNALLSVVLAILAIDVRYDDDALSMRSSTNEGLVQQRRIMQAFGLRFTPYMVRVDGADEAQALERARRLLPELVALEDGERLARVESALPWIPPLAHQAERLRQIESAELDPQQIRAYFEAALGRQGLRASAFSEGLDNLEKALSLERPHGPSDLATTSLGHALSRYVASDTNPTVVSPGDATTGGSVSTVIYAYPPPGKWRREPPPDLVRAVAAAHDGGEPWAVLTGPVIVSAELKKVVWRDALLAGLLGTIGVFLFLARDLRSLPRAALALLPLLLGLLWMLGWMSLAGMAVNFMNLFVFTMILGIGVDYGIHLLHRMAEDDGQGDEDGAAKIEAASGLAPAITVAALTTVAGFGSLVTSDFPGLRSMGGAAIFGVLSVAWLGLTLLPALAGWRQARR